MVSDGESFHLSVVITTFNRYMFATLLSLYNKWMFSPEYYGFKYPLFVTCTHMVVQFSLATVVREVWNDRFKPKEKPSRQDFV